MYINKCYHIDGKEMDKNYKLSPESKIGKQLTDFLSEKKILSFQVDKIKNNVIIKAS